MACARVILDIDARSEHIAKMVSMGSTQADVVTEQYTEILASLSVLCVNDHSETSRISQHLVDAGVFSNPQLFAFSACLRTAAATSRRKKGTVRTMQTNLTVEHCLTESDWEKLMELGKKPKQPSDALEDIIACRLHKCGLVCPDANTLKRTSAIVQACRTSTTKPAEKTAICRGVQSKLKKLDGSTPWPFQYMGKYPRSPFELPAAIFAHAYGDDKPITMPDTIDGNKFKLIVAETKYNKPRKEQNSPPDAIVPTVTIQDGPPSPMAQQHMMNGGPFSSLQNMGPFFQALFTGMQNMGTPNTCDKFKSRIPLQLKNAKEKDSNQSAAAVEEHVRDEVDSEPSGEDDDLEQLEANMLVARTAASKVAATKREEAKADAEAKALAKADEKKSAKTKKEAAASKKEAGTRKVAALKEEAKAAVPKAKGKSAVPTSKAKPGKFDIEIWIAAHVKRAEATTAPKRKNFVSNIHKRSEAAANLCGVVDVQPITKRARESAGVLYDSVHK